jgi:two-component system response regulator YesN
METKGILDRLGVFPTLPDMLAALVSWAKNKFEACLKERQYTRPVRDAQRYIQKNFVNPLTLECVAKQIHLNASYFSTAFKKETGKNFSEYLSTCRINEAKRLLRESNLNISQICSAVGYADIKHFSRLFTKTVGIKPSEYRALHG